MCRGNEYYFTNNLVSIININVEMECIEPKQPQGKNPSRLVSSRTGGTGLLCIFNLPVVGMEEQVNDHLVVAQYPLQAAN